MKNMDSSTEQKLLEKARFFNPDALAEIYDSLSPGIYGYAMRLLGDPCLAEDCVAETFVRYIKALQAGGGPNDHIKAYLYRVAHNWITDQYRRQPPPALSLDAEKTLSGAEDWGQAAPDSGRGAARNSLAGEGGSATSARPVENRAEQNLERRQVRLALRLLTPEQRQVIALRFLEGWEVGEVAACLQKPEGAVKSLQHRAVAALRRFLLPDEKEGAYGYETGN
jgi:RNA polymerase sigma-70 factor (ECF subfamily)